MDKRKFTGRSLDEALAEAAKSFATDKAMLCYNVLQNTSGGFFSKLFSRTVCIEAWIEIVQQDLQAAAREAVRQALSKKNTLKTDLSPLGHSQKKSVKNSYSHSRKDTLSSQSSHHIEPLQKKQSVEFELHRNTVSLSTDPAAMELFAEYNTLFFSAFSLNKSNYHVEVLEDSEVHVSVEDSDIESFLSKSDRLSLAYEHVFKRIAQRKLGDVTNRISLNAGDSAENREQRLVGMARTLAEKVQKTGRSVALSSKSSQERRIIHLALDGFEGVATRSVGTGDKRRLVIYSTERKKPRNNQGQNSGSQTHGETSSKSFSRSKKRFPQKKAKNPHNSKRVGAVSKETTVKNDLEFPSSHQDLNKSES